MYYINDKAHIIAGKGGGQRRVEGMAVGLTDYPPSQSTTSIPLPLTHPTH